LARQGQKRQAQALPTGLIGEWVYAFLQGRGAQGATEAELLKLGNLCAHLYQLLGMSQAQLTGFCHELGQASAPGGLDARLAELDALYDQLAQIGVGGGTPAPRSGSLPKLQRLADL